MKRFQCVVTFLLLGVSLTLHAQNDKQINYWLSAGFGKTKYPSGMIAAGYEPKQSHSVVIARYTFGGELFPKDDPGIKMSEVGLLYGYKIHEFRLAAGVGTVWGMNKGQYLYDGSGSARYYQRLPYNAISVPVEIRYIHFWDDMGVGLTAFGSLSQAHTTGGLNVSLYLGHKAK